MFPQGFIFAFHSVLLQALLPEACVIALGNVPPSWNPFQPRTLYCEWQSLEPEAHSHLWVISSQVPTLHSTAPPSALLTHAPSDKEWAMYFHVAFC